MSIVHLLIDNFADILAFSLGIPTESRSFVEPQFYLTYHISFSIFNSLFYGKNFSLSRFFHYQTDIFIGLPLTKLTEINLEQLISHAMNIAMLPLTKLLTLERSINNKNPLINTLNRGDPSVAG